MAESTDQQAVFAGPSKPASRSAAYPAITIEQALAFVADVYTNFRTGFHKRDDILAVTESKHPRNLAAAAYYLLVDREGDTYKVSDHYRPIASPINEKERLSGLLKSFGAPKLYKTLIEKFDGGVVPTELPIHLSRFHGITEEAAPAAADVFLRNARFCGVISDANVLGYKTALLRLSDPTSDPPPAEQGNPAPQLNPLADLSEQRKTEDGAGNSTQKLLAEMVNEEKTRIRLTRGRFAYLTHPLDLSTTDIQILKKEIEKLELIAGSA